MHSEKINRSDIVKIRSCLFNPSDGQLSSPSRQIVLPRRLSALLNALSRSDGQLVTKREIHREVWGTTTVEESSLAQAVSTLRMILDEVGLPGAIETARGLGYRFLPPVSTVNHAVDARANQPPLLAILPFRLRQRTKSLQVVSEELFEAITSSFTDDRGMRVLARAIVERYRDPVSFASGAACRLGVDLILWGTIEKSSRSLLVKVQTFHTSTLTVHWSSEFREAASQLSELRKSSVAIAHSISTSVRARIKETAPHSVGMKVGNRAVPSDFDATIDYLWRMKTPARLEKGIEYVRLAIDTTPSSSELHAQLARFCLALVQHDPPAARDLLEEGYRSAKRALDMDPKSAEAHIALGIANIQLHFDWKTAETHLARAIELEKSKSTAYHWYGNLLAASGRYDESLSMFERGLRLKADSFSLRTAKAQCLYLSRRYDEARQQLLSLLELNETFAPAHFGLGMISGVRGNNAEAIKYIECSVALSNRKTLFLSSLAFAHSLWGIHAQARSIYKEISLRSKTEYVSPYEFAVLHACLNKPRRALTALAQAIELRAPLTMWMQCDPRLASVKSEADFQRLARRVGVSTKLLPFEHRAKAASNCTD